MQGECGASTFRRRRPRGTVHSVTLHAGAGRTPGAVICFSEGQSPDQQGTGMEAVHPSGCCPHLSFTALEMLQNPKEEGSALAQKQRNWKTRERREWYHTKEAEHSKLGGGVAQRLAVDEVGRGALPFIGPIRLRLIYSCTFPGSEGTEKPTSTEWAGLCPRGLWGLPCLGMVSAVNGFRRSPFTSREGRKVPSELNFTAESTGTGAF